MTPHLRWLLLAFALLIIPGPAQPIIGFKVGGFCAVGCGRDSAVNRLAGDFGAAFTDKAIQQFGEEGRRVVDYANRNLGQTLDDKIKQIDVVATNQREAFVEEMEDLSETATASLAGVLSEGISKLSEEIDVQITVIDETISKQVDRMSVLLAIVVGLLIGCVIVVLMGVNMHTRRQTIKRKTATIMAMILLATGGAGYAVAAVSNTKAEDNRHDKLREYFVKSISEGRLIRAHLLSRKLDALDRNPNNDFMSQKLGLIREAVYNISSAAGEAQLPRLAEFQRDIVKETGSLDPDIAALQVYFASEEPDSLLATSAMLELATSAATLEPHRDLALAQVSKDFRSLACNLVTELKARGGVTTPFVTSQLKEAEFAAGIKASLGFDLPSHRESQASCPVEAIAAATPGSLITLQNHLNWRTRRFALIAAADTMLLRCLLYRLCYVPDESYRSVAPLSTVSPQFDDAVRFLAVEDFIDWYTQQVPLDGPVEGLGRKPRLGELCFSTTGSGVEAILSLKFGCATNEGLPFGQSEISALKTQDSAAWANYLKQASEDIAGNKAKSFRKIQEARRGLEIERLFQIFNSFKRHGLLDAGLRGHSEQRQRAMLQTASEIRSGNNDALTIVSTWTITPEARGALYRALERTEFDEEGRGLLGYLRLCLGRNRMLVACSIGQPSVPLFFLARNESGAESAPFGLLNQFYSMQPNT